MEDIAPHSEERPNEEIETVAVSLEIPISEAPVYANHVGASAMPHEIVLDFFQVLPAGSSGAGRHVSRVILPLSLIKGFADMLNEQIAHYERLGRNLPNLREPGE